MIVHILPSNRYHLTPDIAEGYIKNYKQFNHAIILFGDKQTNKQLYINIFEKLDFKYFHFCQNNKEFVKLLWKYRENPIVFHGGNYFRFILAILVKSNNINWVCWGSGTTIYKTTKSKLSAKIKKLIYSNFNSIVTLMDQDRNSIIEHFKVNPSRIITLPYATGNNDNLNDFHLELLKNERMLNSKPLVLLGNNSCCMEDYSKLLDILRQYSGKISVQCMLHYDLEKNKTYYNLIEKGKYFFGDDFKTNEEFYSDIKEYIKYMNHFDIYICSAMYQTGLGAIGTALKLGKKIFLSGRNYEYFNSKGTKIFKVESINSTLSLESFISPLTMEEKLLNYEKMVETTENNHEKWVKYFNDIIDSN